MCGGMKEYRGEPRYITILGRPEPVPPKTAEELYQEKKRREQQGRDIDYVF